MQITLRGIPPRLGITANQNTDELLQHVGLNPGNLAFTYATALILGFPRSKDWLNNPEKGELSVYPLANQLGEHFIDYSEKLYSSIKNFHEESKIIAIGLGGQNKNYQDFKELPTISEKGWLWIDEISRRSPNPRHPNITVRGEFTRELFEKHGRGDLVTVTGCPSSMLSSHKDLGKIISNKFESLSKFPWLHTTLGCPWSESTKRFEQRIINLTEFHKGLCHVQMDLREVKLARGDLLSENELLRSRNQIAPHIQLSEFPGWAKRNLRVWWDVPAWMEGLSCADFVFGSRIHGINLAIQAGTPALCAAWDSRTYELCQQMNIPHINMWEEPWISGDFSWDDIRREFESQFDPEKFDRERKETALKFINLFENHGAQTSSHIKNIASQTKSNPCLPH